MTVEGQPPRPPGQGLTTDVRVCDNGYFRAMNIGLLRGRLFTEREMTERSDVVVINETMARQYFSGDDPLGKRVTISMTNDDRPTEIVGVVGDVKYIDLTIAPRPMAYWPHPQLSYAAMTLTIRTASDPSAYASLVAREIQALDKDQPVSDVRTMDQWVAKSLAQARFNSVLLAVFAGFALVLAAVGIYGVMAYAVSQRTSEIGIRLALGAHQRNILGMIVGNAVRLTAIALAIGAILSVGLSRTLTRLLYDTRGADPSTMVAVAVVLGTVAIFASYIPARRASRVDPIVALRYE